jgi:cytidylate kinase
LIIAIDGYSACGKSTFAKAIARELKYTYIDSGAMYRAVTLYCLNNNFIHEGALDIKRLINNLPNIYIKFTFNPELNRYDTYLNDKNVEEEIRSVTVSNYVSPVSKIKEVRAKLVEIQRSLSTDKKTVMDGRDIGSVVFPDADIKIFLTASVAVRARRRYDEMVAKGLEVSLQEVEKNITKRDNIDENRDISPLTIAPGAIILDNSNMTVEQQMRWFMKIYNRVQAE